MNANLVIDLINNVKVYQSSKEIDSDTTALFQLLHIQALGLQKRAPVL